MKKNIFNLLAILASSITIFVAPSCNEIKPVNADGNLISFYSVPLVCGAAPEIGCGSRIKPFFLDTEKEKQVKESWSNREGTIIALIWDESAKDEKTRESLIEPLFKKHKIDAKLISDDKQIENYMTSMKADKWYKGMEVDSLSLEEAGVIAEDLTKFALDKELINSTEKEKIKSDLQAYFRKELVIVRTCDELKSEETQGKWRADGYQIYVNHIGKERADKVASYFEEYDEMKKEECKKDGKKSCCEKDTKGNKSCEKK